MSEEKAAPQSAVVIKKYANRRLYNTATSAYVLASRMGYDGSFVAGLVTLSTLLGMLSLPFALGLLRHL